MEDHDTSWWSTVSLRTRITGVTVLLVTLGLVVAGFGTMTVLRNYLQDEVDQKIKTEMATIGNVPTSGTTCGKNPGFDGYYLAVIDADGDFVCSNHTGSGPQPNLGHWTLTTVKNMEGAAFTASDPDQTSEWRMIAAPAQIIPTGSLLTVVVGINLDETNQTIARFIGIFLGFGLSIVVLGAALTRLLVTSTFAPLREVEATAAAIADGDFSQRLPGATPNTEVGRLNSSLNTMLGRIDRAFADRSRTITQMRRFVGDASHELRTPLVSVRGYAELYRMGALQSPEEVAQAMGRIEKEAIRMGELVEDLLALARIDEAKPLVLAPVDLIPIANDAALDAMASAPRRTVSVVVIEPAPQPEGELMDVTDADPDLAAAPLNASTLTGPIAFAGATIARLRRRPAKAGANAVTEQTETIDTVVPHAIVLAEENKIRQVITNLIGNAMRFTPDDSPIELAVQVDPQRRVAMLDVIDHGDGIPPQIREKIFERFWRADTSRTRETGGSGLGLAIVSGIVASHRGEVSVLETPDGGATFRVILPLLPDSYSPPPAPIPA
jgi:two-component system OmpR family sensor kinase